MNFNEKELLIAVSKSISNSEDLISDADLLVDNDRLARAHALYQLAIEEAGKAMDVYGSLLLGTFKDSEGQKILKENFKSHIKKAGRAAETGGKISRSYNQGEASGKITNHAYYYYGSKTPEEYQVKNAKDGKYKIRVSYSDYGRYHYDIKVPTVIRILSFKNSGKENEVLTVENVIMDNQFGEVEIAEVNWEGAGVKN